MSLLTSIVAAGLAIADFALSYFVRVTDTGIDVGNADCGVSFDVWNAEMTVCGSAFVDMLMRLEFQDLLTDIARFVWVVS